MKKQIILTIIIAIILAFLIFKTTYHEEMNILTLGDGLAKGMTMYNVLGYSYNDYLRDYYEENSILRDYITEFASIDETTTTLINKINTNYQLKPSNLTIQQAISKAKIITICIGMEQLNNLKNIKAKDIDNYLKEMDQLLQKIRIFNKKQIILLSLYKTTKLKTEDINNINKTLNEISHKYQITFLDISYITNNNEYYFNPKNFYLNYKGHREIFKLIKDNLQ